MVINVICHWDTIKSHEQEVWRNHCVPIGVESFLWKAWAIVLTSMGKDPCCIPSALVWASRFLGSSGSSGQAPPFSNGCPCTPQSWADNLKVYERKGWKLYQLCICLARVQATCCFLSRKPSSVVSMVFSSVTNRSTGENDHSWVPGSSW